MAAGDVITIIENSVGRKGNYFDGTDDYVLHDAHVVERVAANDTEGTYTAWIYLTSVTGAANNTIISAGDNDSANEYFQIFTYNNSLRITLKQGGATQFLVKQSDATASLLPRRWTHIAVVQNGTRPNIYINGELCSMTDTTATDLTMWYDELANCDKFAIGVLESNGTHTNDFAGAIGQVKYWNRALSAAEILRDYNGDAQINGDYPDSTYLRLNVTMADNGTTDSGAGADNGTLTGNAHYGSYISTHSIALETNTTGHAAERSTTFDISPGISKTVIVRGD